MSVLPLLQTVFECDFLQVGLSSKPPPPPPPPPLSSTTLPPINLLGSTPVIRELPAGWFDVVVFSLLLSYLPSPSQRMTCCLKAHQALKTHGLLLVLTPDSSHQNRHAALMKDWRTAMEALGFHRWRYAKLSHLHCMALRKTRTSVDYTAVCEQYGGLLAIPQDSHEGDRPGGMCGGVDGGGMCGGVDRGMCGGVEGGMCGGVEGGMCGGVEGGTWEDVACTDSEVSESFQELPFTLDD